MYFSTIVGIGIHPMVAARLMGILVVMSYRLHWLMYTCYQCYHMDIT